MKARPAIHGRDHRLDGEDPIGLFVTAYVKLSGLSDLPDTGPLYDRATVPVITDGDVWLYEPEPDDPVFDLSDPDTDEGVVILRTGLFLVWHKLNWKSGAPSSIVNFRATSFNSRNEGSLQFLAPGEIPASGVRPDDGETHGDLQYGTTGDTSLTALGSYGNSAGGTSQGGASALAHLGIGYSHNYGDDAHVYWELYIARIADLGFDI